MHLVIMVVLWVLFVSSAPIVVLIPAIVLLVGLIILLVSAANSAKEAKKRYQARHNPAVLHFKMLKRNSDGTWTGTTQQLHVLVPRGHEAEAEQLRQRYYAEVIAPWKQPATYNPPEPT